MASPSSERYENARLDHCPAYSPGGLRNAGRRKLSLASRPVRPVSTYSIVARDPDTGDLGVAVQSHWFSVGALVPWARAGVGAVATQSMVEASYGPKGLDMMAEGNDAVSVLSTLLEQDPHADIRQVAMVDARRRPPRLTPAGAVFRRPDINWAKGTRSRPISWGRPRCPRPWPRPSKNRPALWPNAWWPPWPPPKPKGATSAAGSRPRSWSSAPNPRGQPWNDRLVDLRVEDHPNPVKELERLLRLHRGYEQMNAGDLAVEKGDLAGAEKAYAQAEHILGGNLEARYWHAVAMVNAGQIDRALPIFADIFLTGGQLARVDPAPGRIRIPAGG